MVVDDILSTDDYKSLKGIDPNIHVNNGYPILHEAVDRGAVKCVNFLLKNKAHIQIFYNRCPLNWLFGSCYGLKPIIVIEKIIKIFNKFGWNGCGCCREKINIYYKLRQCLSNTKFLHLVINRKMDINYKELYEHMKTRQSKRYLKEYFCNDLAKYIMKFC